MLQNRYECRRRCVEPRPSSPYRYIPILAISACIDIIFISLYLALIVSSDVMLLKILISIIIACRLYVNTSTLILYLIARRMYSNLTPEQLNYINSYYHREFLDSPKIEISFDRMVFRKTAFIFITNQICVAGILCVQIYICTMFAEFRDKDYFSLLLGTILADIIYVGLEFISSLTVVPYAIYDHCTNK